MGFLFNRKKKLADSGVFDGFVERHCHILPGVDDGVETLDESLAILDLYRELGVSEVWLTPHVMEDIPNTPDKLRERFATLTEAYSGPIRLHLSAEHMLDTLFQQRLGDGQLLPWGDKGDKVLVETSFFNPPSEFHTTLSRIASQGYFPVLAHPERYLYMDHAEYRKLKDMHVSFQLNLFSLLGQYGEHVEQNAQYLLKEGLYDYVGTDLHSIDTLHWALGAKLPNQTLTLLDALLHGK